MGQLAGRFIFAGGVSPSFFLGDVGGGSGAAAPSIVDLDINSVRPSIYLMTSVNFSFLEIELALNTGLLSGDDKYSTNIYRKNRNLHFRSSFFELTGRFKYYLIKPYIIAFENKKTGIAKSFKFGLHVFGGAGITFFNPQAKYNGVWHDLQPLSTEGQGLEGGPVPYKLYTPVLVQGVGFNYWFNRHIGLGMDIVNRYTFTDYIDDVSGVYYDIEKIREAKGDVAAELAGRDLSIEDIPYVQNAGAQRGGEGNDAYFTLDVYVLYKLSKLRTRGRGIKGRKRSVRRKKKYRRKAKSRYSKRNKYRRRGGKYSKRYKRRKSKKRRKFSSKRKRYGKKRKRIKIKGL